MVRCRTTAAAAGARPLDPWVGPRPAGGGRARRRPVTPAGAQQRDRGRHAERRPAARRPRRSGALAAAARRAASRRAAARSPARWPARAPVRRAASRSAAANAEQVRQRAAGAFARPRASTASTRARQRGATDEASGGCVLDVAPGLGGEPLAGKRPATGQQLVGDDRQRIAIAGRCGRLASGLLRREVGGGAEQLTAGGDRRLAGDARDAEVGRP